MIKTKCREVRAVRDLFVNGTVTVASKLDKFRYIGPYILGQAKARYNIETVAQLLQQASQKRNKADIDKMLERCTLNRRRGTCARQGPNKPKYHIPDVNVCGYNTLLAILKFAHQYPNQYTIPGNLHLERVTTIKPRHRGSVAGSRFCSCVDGQAACAVHNQDCRWNNSQQVCVARARGKGSGFRGRRASNNAHIPQYNPLWGRARPTIRQGHVYSDRWRGSEAQPFFVAGGENGGEIRGAGALPASCDDPFTPEELAFLKKSVVDVEKTSTNKNGDARRMFNFVLLTNPVPDSLARVTK